MCGEDSYGRRCQKCYRKGKYGSVSRGQNNKKYLERVNK